MKMIKIASALTAGLILAGCESRIDVVNQEMANIRNQPALPIEPAPDFAPVELPHLQPDKYFPLCFPLTRKILRSFFYRPQPEATTLPAFLRRKR